VKKIMGRKGNRCLRHVKRLMLTMYSWAQLVGLVGRRMVAKEIKVIKESVLVIRKQIALVRNSWTDSTPENSRHIQGALGYGPATGSYGSVDG
jgi:hypothetical protein